METRERFALANMFLYWPLAGSGTHQGLRIATTQSPLGAVLYSRHSMIS
jgi:hypothetical protein